tara:strand:+ start:1344 stop:1736 length:393 start_codon:yes stop_codon:yes gene_type:complete
MKKTTLSIIHLIVVVLTFVSVLRGQNLDYYVDSDFELLPIPPELVPYQIVPLDPIPDCRLEMGIELIYPQSITDMPEPQREETLQIIYKRIAYEISNPDRTAGLFQIDGRMYHLIRIPYTGASTKFWGWE